MENLDFLNQNTLRAFPIKEGTTRISTDSRMVIPDNCMVDLILALPASLASRVYVSEVVNLADQIVIRLAVSGGSTVGSFTINVATHTIYSTYLLSPTSTYQSAAGKLSIAYLEGMAEQPLGSFLFSLESTEVEMRTVIPSSSGVSSVSFIDTNAAPVSLTGDIKIYARNNMRFAVAGSTVTMDAANGLGLNESCDTTSAEPIKTINHIAPDSQGNFTISFTDCDSITPATNGIVLTDACNKPCMGCNEIATLTQRLMTLEGDLVKLRTYFDGINASVVQFSNVVNLSCELP